MQCNTSLEDQVICRCQPPYPLYKLYSQPCSKHTTSLRPLLNLKILTMASSFCSILVVVTLGVLVGFAGRSSAQLSTNFYSKSCPKVFSAVKSVVQSAISKENRMGASLLRLHFHDCFVNVRNFFLIFLQLYIYMSVNQD